MLSTHAVRIELKLQSERIKCLQHAEQSTVFPHCTWHAQKCTNRTLAPSSYEQQHGRKSRIWAFPLGSSVFAAHQPVNCKSLATHVTELPEGGGGRLLTRPGDWLSGSGWCTSSPAPPLFLSVNRLSDQLSPWHIDQQKQPDEQPVKG